MSTLAVIAMVLAASPVATPAEGATPTLVEVRAAHHPGFDRIVFEFEGPLPSRTTARWVDRIVADGSGRPLPVQGAAFISVVMEPVRAHLDVAPFRTTYGPRKRAYDLPNIAHLVNAGDFEAVVSFGIGLMRRSSILRTARLRDPSRFVIDVSTRFRRDGLDIFLAEEAPGVSGVPAIEAVGRTVPARGRAPASLMRLFAGPTVEEKAAGMRFVSSSATGFRDLRVSDSGIARVRLVGGCDGHGSSITVADEIMPTLRQLPRVRWVKILDPEGSTRHPWGARDSIPDCLAR